MRTTNSFALLIFIAILGVGVAGLWHVRTFDHRGKHLDRSRSLRRRPRCCFCNSGCESVGQGGGLAAGSFSRSRGTGTVFHHPDHRNGTLLDRHSRHHHFLQGGKTLTKDTVPVDVDAVLFWKVWTRRRRRSTLPTIEAPSAGPPKRLCAT